MRRLKRLGERRPGSKRKRLVRLAVLVILLLAGVVTLRTGVEPDLLVSTELPGFGRATPVTVRASTTGRGLDQVRVTLRQGDLETRLVERQYESRAPWAFWGPRSVLDSIDLEVGSETVPQLEEGEATLEVEARAPGTWLRRAPAVITRHNYPVILRPPAVVVTSDQHYPAQGGAEVVVYRIGKTAVRDGVRSAGTWYPGYPLPGSSADMRFALFAVPFDLEDAALIELEAEDILGNTTKTAFVDRFLTRPYKTDTINVTDRFMAKVVPEIQSNTPGLVSRGDLLQDYVAINRDLRQRNTRTLQELASSSRQQFLWDEAFSSLPNAKVMSTFADRRTYLYGGEEIDHQDHLGFDLASIKRAEVPASNAGLVVLARYFGIYGNAVVIDHGYGLMSLYGHLSSLEVVEGDIVEAGQVVGRTGISGLALGDHLHFTMLLHGEAVNPVEWWDGKWIRDRLKRKLGSAMPFPS